MTPKDQIRGHKAIETKVHQTYTQSLMDRQCCAHTKKRSNGNIASSALMSFMDCFTGYNQIKMAPRDMTRTTFTIE